MSRIEKACHKQAFYKKTAGANLQTFCKITPAVD